MFFFCPVPLTLIADGLRNPYRWTIDIWPCEQPRYRRSLFWHTFNEYHLFWLLKQKCVVNYVIKKATKAIPKLQIYISDINLSSWFLYKRIQNIYSKTTLQKILEENFTRYNIIYILSKIFLGDILECSLEKYAYGFNILDTRKNVLNFNI